MLTNENNHLMLTDKTYDFMKKLVQIFLPAFGALYFSLGNIWGFPEIENVVGSIAVIATFLGAIMGISTSQYNKSGAAFDGRMVVSPQEDKTMFSLELKKEPEDIADKDSIRFKVHRANRPLEADRD